MERKALQRRNRQLCSFPTASSSRNRNTVLSEKFYKKVCGVDLDIVLDNLRNIYLAGKHLEVTNLIINDYNDSLEEIEQLCDFIVDELSVDVPLHFSRAFPYYKMRDIEPTNKEILFKAREIAIKKGKIKISSESHFFPFVLPFVLRIILSF